MMNRVKLILAIVLKSFFFMTYAQVQQADLAQTDGAFITESIKSGNRKISINI